MSTTPGQIIAQIDELAGYLPHIVDEEPATFDQHVHRQLDRLAALAPACPDDQRRMMDYCLERCAAQMTQSPFYRRMYQKPLGYAGDYLTLDWIYTQRVQAHGRGGLWDAFFQRLAAAAATRERKDFLGRVFAQRCAEAKRGLTVLDLACGPCRVSVDAVQRAGASAQGSHFHCVDSDARAIAYGQQLVQRCSPHVSFAWERANVLRLRSAQRYDLVWAAGLFDYLTDRLARALLHRMWQWTTAGGSLIIGNAAAGNPSRHVLDWCIDWPLIHRTPDDLQRLCAQAGIPAAGVSVQRDPRGVYLYCTATKAA